MQKLIVLGLGCNLGDRKENLRTALERVGSELLDNLRSSSVYPNKAMLPDNAPAEWNIDFYNIVATGYLKDPSMTPQQFLFKIKLIEADLGRKPSELWAPREMDIDILAWGDEIIESESLVIPHKGLTERDFTVIPLAEIASNWKHPKTGKMISEYLEKFK